MATPPCTLLQTIPTEILELILEEVKRCSGSFATFCNLRLVSKELNSLVEPFAFASFSLPRYDLRSPAFCSQLKCLASGRSPNSRWTKQLRILERALPPLQKETVEPPWGRTDPEVEEQARQRALVVQRSHFVRAIDALKHVTHVVYHLRDNEAYEDVLLALARLPNLENLSLSFCSGFRNKPLPLASFSNLRAVRLTHPHFHPSVIKAIKDMLERSSTTLESLILAPFGWGPTPSWLRINDLEVLRVAGLEKFLAEDLSPTIETKPSPRSFLAKLNPVQKRKGLKHRPTPSTPTQYPRLKDITINLNRVSLSAAVVPYIPSLVHLEAKDNSSGSVDDSFWKALTKAHIQLEFLKIWPITRPLVQYVSSYSGLRTLYLRDPEDGEPIPQGEADRLLTVAIPHQHGQTLEGLWLEGPTHKGYDLSEERLKGVLGCHRLRNLWISFYFFPEAGLFKRRNNDDSPEPPSIDLSTLFSSLTTSLPNLHVLYIDPTHRVPHFGCGTGRMGYVRGVKKRFLEAVSEVSIAGQTPSFSVEVKGILGDLVLDFDKGTRKFVVIRDLQEEARRALWMY